MPSDQSPLPQGFRTSGLHCGIKSDPDTLDLALFVSDRPCAAAGVFTQNRVCGAPVKVSRERVPRATCRAVIINSGNANACTGAQGLKDARWMTDEIAAGLGCSADDVLVCSTGVIGHPLPREALAGGLPAAVDRLAATPDAFTDAARGMMTTDTIVKQSVRQADFDGTTVTISGAAKGAAMIAPNMATMLAVIMADAPLSPDEADRMLRHAIDRSFNCISVDGHMSTSDTVILLAGGTADSGPLGVGNQQQLQTMIDEVAIDLAQAIIRDAEGAAHFITIDVHGLRSAEQASRIARAVADSPLVKTAIAGADPNWGRIVSAVGYADVDLQEEEISLAINGTTIYRAGSPLVYDERAVSDQMRTDRDVHIDIEIAQDGFAAVRFWTSDLTAEYVRLNAEYTT